MKCANTKAGPNQWRAKGGRLGRRIAGLGLSATNLRIVSIDPID